MWDQPSGITPVHEEKFAAEANIPASFFTMTRNEEKNPRSLGHQNLTGEPFVVCLL